MVTSRYRRRYRNGYRNEYRTRRYGRYGRRPWGARRSEGSGAVETLARLGFVARGIAYIAIGIIALMLAFGIARHEPDRAGALEAIATKPFGYLLLWILVIGFAGLALWRLMQAAQYRLNPTEGHRLHALGAGIAYAIAFFSTLMFVLHGRPPTSTDTTSRDLSAEILSWDGGQFLLLLIGLVLVGVGIWVALRGLRMEFTEHLRMGWMRASTRRAVERLGRIGYLARGLVVAGIGVAIVDAALTYSSGKAKGVDGVLREFAQSPIGPWLLVLVALGLIAFGLLSFFEAKWRRTYGGVPV